MKTFPLFFYFYISHITKKVMQYVTEFKKAFFFSLRNRQKKISF